MEQKTMEQIEQELSKPTPASVIMFLPAALTNDGAKCLCIPYFKRHFIEDRLDQVCGPLGWQTRCGTEGGVLVYGIGIMNPQTSEWIWKWDTGVDSAGDGSNSAITGGIKRCGWLWGIGRDIASLVGKYRACTTRPGKGGKPQFARWANAPSIAEIIQYNSWLRAQQNVAGTGNGHQDADMPEDKEAVAEAAEAVAETLRQTDDRVGKDPVSQFWHVANNLIDAGRINREDVQTIINESRMESEGGPNYEVAKTELLKQVGEGA